MEGIWDSVSSWFRDNLSDWGLVKIYIACAVAGGAVLLGQTGLSLFGIGDADGDVDADMDVDDIDGGDSLNFLSIRALAGFLTFFGLIGWAGTANEWGNGLTALAAFAAGASVMVFVALIMRFFRRMHAEGTLRPDQALGKTARVYLRIPGEKSGKGKITVSIGGRTVEFDAVTSGAEIPTGSECRVLKQTTEDTFEVAPAD